MGKRFVSICFRYLLTDWLNIRKPELANSPFVITSPSHGRMMIIAANHSAESEGVLPGQVLADARAMVPSLLAFDEIPGLKAKLLKKIAEWAIRFSPCTSMDAPDGICIDASGCSHLWGSEQLYIADLQNRLRQKGYSIQIAMADTVGAAWALARFGRSGIITEAGKELDALKSLPPEALRIEPPVAERLHKLGLRQLKDFINMPTASLRRRFGFGIVHQLKKIVGEEDEYILPIIPVEIFQERLPCLEPIVNATGIEIALNRLLEALCRRLQLEQKGIRKASLKCYRTDGKIVEASITTHSPSSNITHLFKLFKLKIESIEPADGIELFVLEAVKVQEHTAMQESLWNASGGLENPSLSKLLDRFAGKFGSASINRYLPAEHYWPERSYKKNLSLQEKPSTHWQTERPRPLQLLSIPEKIEVTAPVPDYPPMLFRYRNKLHKIIKAEGPERIEQEWWLQDGPHRDYYYVEDEEGCRYWLFRSGHYDENSYQWFLHGFFS